MNEKILVTGGSGKLATAINKTFNCLCPPKEELNVTNYHNVKDYLKYKPDVEYIIHAGALTSVEKCEAEKNLAYLINVEGTRNVIEAIKENNTYQSGSLRKIKLIYMSTPCVFDGKTGNYDENSLPFPENYYGYTKAIAEELVISSGLEYLIIRSNFVPREKWKYPKAFSDRFGTYLFADQVAEALKYHIANSSGILHIVGDKKLSMYELAKKCNAFDKTETVTPMTMKQYSGKAKLTINMTMNSVRWTSYKIPQLP